MLPNQDNKLSSNAIIRQTPKIEIEISTEEEQEEEMLTGEIEIADKHMSGKHNQQSHSHASSSGISNPNAQSMSGQDKIRAAEIMYGTGSKQHMQAQQRFGKK